MVTIECPWCAEEERLPLVAVADPQADFTCSECGTSVSWVEEPRVVPEAAAWSPAHDLHVGTAA